MQSPKPRIRKSRGVWCCGTGFVLYSAFLMCGNLGHGYTPAEAYLDWKEQQ
jgi:hypothetical protein